MTAWVLILMMALGSTERVVPSMQLAEQIAAASMAHPLPGDRGQERMAAVLVAIGWAESRFASDAVGDRGQSLGAFQISRAWARPPEGEAELAARLVAQSFRICAGKKLEARLAFYAAGGNGCSDRGVPASRWRMHLARRLLKEYPRDVD